MKENSEEPSEVDTASLSCVGGMANDRGDKCKETNPVKYEPPQMGLKFVHLDLKGAPPKISYLAEIFPVFAYLGADGVLLEYEDMFPYEGQIEVLRSPIAYSVPDIKEIINLARVNNLEIIPLVQTFGHLEFVLKHEKFSHLREVETFPNTINPHKQESLYLIKSMIDQVMAAHVGIRWFHIGSDEVYYLGEGGESKDLILQQQFSMESMYMSHVKAVATQVLANNPGVKPIIWDDYLRNIDEDKLKESMLGKLVEPMIWNYNSVLDVPNIQLLIEKYHNSGLSKIWFASAFKGATGVAQCVPNISYHLENHLQWLKVADGLPKHSIQLQGITLTGWQRYDHFSVLCELLPVAIPSLAVCLQALKEGNICVNEETFVKRALEFSDSGNNFTSGDGAGKFPGYKVMSLVAQVTADLKKSIDELLEENMYIKGWFSEYHRRQKIVHPVMIHQFEGDVRGLHAKWEQVLIELRSGLERIYYPLTVVEWLEEHVSPAWIKLEKFIRDMNEAKSSKLTQYE
ncbi:hexosaminidase D isoform X2 [Callorhinchus milii]|uniref:hexosaminidase D isoform X2 n=1 Tax=Callorhinchus milii TaxID=7868 RepID=UPI0004573B2F|nr:hexosaminidase D isoform X2 [Callorhinchus milii]|eukprot:gi/632942870/ref/XP_007886660.1/ PREDICTED: hexosaminidase D isoform X2 [Callorhinchus milii]